MTTEAWLREELRFRLGSPTTTQFSDDGCDRSVKSAIREYSRYKPIRVLDYLVTVANTAVYSLSAKAGILQVKRVWYSTDPTWIFSNYFPDLDMAFQANVEGISIFENQSVWTVYTQKLEQYRNNFEGDHSYNETTKELRLIPTPTTGGDNVYYIWTKQRAAETVIEEDIDGVMMWAMAVAKQSMAGAQQQAGIQSVAGFGISGTVSTTPGDLMKESATLKDEFRARFRRGGSVTVG